MSFLEKKTGKRNQKRYTGFDVATVRDKEKEFIDQFAMLENREAIVCFVEAGAVILIVGERVIGSKLTDENEKILQAMPLGDIITEAVIAVAGPGYKTLKVRFTGLVFKAKGKRWS